MAAQAANDFELAAVYYRDVVTQVVKQGHMVPVMLSTA
jgi:hypothetical protein